MRISLYMESKNGNNTIRLILDEKLKNIGESCLAKCSQSGPCVWCGTEGLCCKKDGEESNGCDGLTGGINEYECAEKIQGKDFKMS